jgi:hypothetical protein
MTKREPLGKWDERESCGYLFLDSSFLALSSMLPSVLPGAFTGVSAESADEAGDITKARISGDLANLLLALCQQFLGVFDAPAVEHIQDRPAHLLLKAGLQSPKRYAGSVGDIIDSDGCPEVLEDKPQG